MAKTTIDTVICKGCELCVGACPRNIIELAQDVLNAKGHHPARVIDQERCTGCAACAVMCPDCAITVER